MDRSNHASNEIQWVVRAGRWARAVDWAGKLIHRMLRSLLLLLLLPLIGLVTYVPPGELSNEAQGVGSTVALSSPAVRAEPARKQRARMVLPRQHVDQPVESSEPAMRASHVDVVDDWVPRSVGGGTFSTNELDSEIGALRLLQRASRSEDLLARAVAAPVTPVAEPTSARVVTYELWPARNVVVPYAVQERETVTSIARKFGLRPTTILWANEQVVEATGLLKPGREIVIPPLDGVLYTAAEGDTFESIGAAYGVSPGLIAWFAGDQPGDPAPLAAGQRVMLPGARKAIGSYALAAAAGMPVLNRVGGEGYFAWPTGGRISQPYGPPTHGGLDIAAPINTPIFAAERGQITFSGWDDVYGYAIFINHQNGWSTRYAHLSGMYYQVGDWVERGQLIGVAGSTGQSTGPHLHFEVRYWGRHYDPLEYLSR
ncbi:MAG: peptidoglycan DD-metalloendopeptidase family protein [Chloroflexota bacterium]|nr:peptidoglycan DD-metalloendopeptidase family protein [Chloroflexota bacterium]